MTGCRVKTQEKNFEGALEELEQIVAQLENGKLPLEQGIAKFEQGVKLYKQCKAVLDKAEKRIAILTKDLKESNKEFVDDEDV